MGLKYIRGVDLDQINHPTHLGFTRLYWSIVRGLITLAISVEGEEASCVLLQLVFASERDDNGAVANQLIFNIILFGSTNVSTLD